MRKLTHQEILAARQENKTKERNPISIVLNDVRSLYNVGAIFRIADGIRAEKIYLCGITGTPPAEGEARRGRPNRAITKTALGAEETVPWEYQSDACALLLALKSRGDYLIAMEHTDQSILYSEVRPTFPVCLIVGNEVSGVDPEILRLAHCAVEIPMLGEKNSLNAAVATGIVSYQILASFGRGEKTLNFLMNQFKTNGF